MNRSPYRAARVVSLVTLMLLAALPASARTVKVSFVLLCDIYEMEPVQGRGGIARVASAVKAERVRAAREGSHVFVAHAGDAISPSLMSGFDKGEHMIDLLNRVGIDVFVPGNHEFDFGKDIFRQRMQEAQFRRYAANLRDEKGEPMEGFRDGQLIDFDGVKFGIFGITAEDAPTKSEPGDLRFLAAVATAEAMAKQMKKDGADIVVAVAHAERAVDWKLLETGAIDLLLSGDDHDLVVYFNGSSAFIESKQEGDYVTVADLSVDVSEKDGRRKVNWWPEFRIIDTEGLAPDNALEARIADYRKELSGELDVPLGTLETAVDTRSNTMRTGEAAMGNLVADALRDATGADIAITNGGGIRGNKQYQPGHVLTRRDVLTELPFRNLTVMIELTGKQIRAILENGLSTADEAAGRFPQVSGLHVVADIAKPVGKRVESVLVNGEPLSDRRHYKVATNDYMGEGHEGYGAFREGRPLIGESDAKMISNDVMAYIRKQQKLAPVVEGRIVLKR